MFALLSACVPDVSNFAGLGETQRLATQSVTLNDGFRVLAPNGYCIDTSVTRQTGGNAVVVLASCANLGGKPGSGPLSTGLMTLTVQPGSHGDIGELAGAVRGNPGLLGRGGSVTLHALETSRVALYANLSDVQPGGPAGTDPRHWKAAFDSAGHAITLSIFGAENSPLTGNAGEELARDTAQVLLEANQNSTPPELSAQSVAIDAPASENTPNRVGQLFGRIFPVQATSL